MGFQTLSSKFVILAVLDGWGIAPDSPGNAITKASKPNMDKFWHTFPHAQLEASGEHVGLPHGEAGNTETGHLNLGAGTIVYQDLQRINRAIADGSFFDNEALKKAINHAKQNGSKLHLMGLMGAGGVHSNIEHLYALIQLCAREKFTNVFLHIFTDGRDSPPNASKSYLKALNEVLAREGVGKIASVMGRYWAMDRDFRWERTQKAYLALTRGEGQTATNDLVAVENSYQAGKTDEFIEPTLIVGESGKPLALIETGDAVIFFNFRIDRPRQLTSAFVFGDFSSYQGLNEKEIDISKQQVANHTFDRQVKIKNLCFITMTEYGKRITKEGGLPAFPPQVVELPLSAVVSNNNMRQLKVTESEKERFVTFYFNGLREAPFVDEHVIIVPSQKVPTYDQKPEMSADVITKTVIDNLTTSDYKFCLINFPNADMVGHTGNIDAAITGIQFLDSCLGKLASFVLAYNGALVITADHGNAEEMISLKTGEMDTEHSTNQVPFIIIHKDLLGRSQALRSGILADVAPTVLKLLGVPIPSAMSGRNILEDLTLF